MERAGELFWRNPNGKRRCNELPESLSKLTKFHGGLSKRPVWGLGSLTSQRTLNSGQYKSPMLPDPTKSSASQPLLTAHRDPPTETANSNIKVTNRSEDKLVKPVSELPARFRQLFPYISFNHVQSLVYDTIMNSNRPVVVSAPTGSGKTGVFELAIIKMIMDSETRPMDLGLAKIIYLAPTKALCTERRLDWEKKFKDFNIQVIELTSDITAAINFKNLNKSSILVATPEKWDSITRSWNGHRAFVQSIRLLLVDEVHLVNDGSRGATLEAVISRMKTIRAIIWPTEQDNLRFVAVSATVSNVKDISTWFSTPNSEAEIFQVDPRERPVKLRTVVLGYTCSDSLNEFSFDNQLNRKLPDIIKDYSNEKPTLIFCATRKSCATAAKALTKEGKFDVCFSNEKRKLYLKLSSEVKDSTLQETTRFGVAYHHAGLCLSDRKLIETGFIEGRVMILCCTSTLAMGVNLPAHLVIIKNTSYFDEGQFKPYSESSLVQMIGRAGRPQFDTDATAVILTKSQCRDDIEKMLTGKLIVDSQLHKYLTEHINSEIVLGTINNDHIARKWVEATFLQVRLMKNPENYGLSKNSSKAIKESTIINWCKNSIDQLLKHRMVRRSTQGQLEATDAGRSMARHYISLNTMIKLVQLEGTESLWDLLRVVCSSQEVTSDIQMRIEDRPALSNLLNPKEGENKLRFPINEKISSRDQKAAALIQATFGNINIPDSSLLQESMRIIRNASRVVSCLRDVALLDDGIKYNLLVNVLILSQCFAAKLWENSEYVSKQLERIGAILSGYLARNGLTTFESLRVANPRNIEIFCNRLPPFGSSVQQTCLGLPIYDLDIHFRSIPNHNEKIQLIAKVAMINGQDVRNHHSLPKSHVNVLVVGDVKNNKLLLRQQVADSSLLLRPDLTLCLGVDLDRSELPDNHDKIEGYLLSEMFVGLNIHKVVEYIEPEEVSY